MQIKLTIYLKMPSGVPKDSYLKDLLQMTYHVLRVNPEAIYTGQPENAQDPSAAPFVWLTKWVDYSNKYGMGYELCDNSIGVLFEDATHLMLKADGENLEYYFSKSKVSFTLENHLPELSTKINILQQFQTFMIENLFQTAPRNCEGMTQLPRLRSWFYSKSAIVFHLSNGTFQVNFKRDHTKIVLCPIKKSVSIIDENDELTTYSMELLQAYGCDEILATKLKYAKKMIEKLFVHYNETDVESYRNGHPL